MDMTNLGFDEIKAVLSRLDCYCFIKDQQFRCAKSLNTLLFEMY